MQVNMIESKYPQRLTIIWGYKKYGIISFSFSQNEYVFLILKKICYYLYIKKTPVEYIG